MVDVARALTGARTAVVAGIAVALLALSVGPGIAQAQTATATPAAAPSGPVAAPIENLEIAVQSQPPQWTAVVRSGLPSGCAAFHSISAQRTDTRFEVMVLNTMNVPPSGACTTIYRMTTSSVRLGGVELQPGTTYTVAVNSNTPNAAQTTFTTPPASTPTPELRAQQAPRPASTGSAGLVEMHRDQRTSGALLLGGAIAASLCVLAARRASRR